MKRSEAMNKWCPHTGVSCYASRCMMWEVERADEYTKATLGGTPKGEGWILLGNDAMNSNWHRIIDTDEGDCGLKSKYLECNQQ